MQVDIPNQGGGWEPRARFNRNRKNTEGEEGEEEERRGRKKKKRGRGNGLGKKKKIFFFNKLLELESPLNMFCFDSTGFPQWF